MTHDFGPKIITTAVNPIVFGTETLPIIESDDLSHLISHYFDFIFNPIKAKCDQDHTPVLLKKNGNNTPIGILGGMGPEASIKMLTLISKKYPDASIYTLMVPKTPDRTQAILTQPDLQEKIHYIFNHASQFLSDLGCTQIVLPCNTAHYFSASVLNIKSMVDATTELLKKRDLNSIVILSTKGTRDAQIYTHLPVKQVISINDDEQAKITSAIYDEVKSKGVTEKAIDLFIEVVAPYYTQGFTTFGLCCTELPLIAQDPRTAQKLTTLTPIWIDPMEAVVSLL